jgi:hypothetical protein
MSAQNLPGHEGQNQEDNPPIDPIVQQIAEEFGGMQVVIQNSGKKNEEAQDSAQDFGSAMDMFSGMVAALNAFKSCPIHERCDGSCTGKQINFRPLQSEFAESKVTVTSRSAVILPSAAPKDAAWFAQQELEDFSYDGLALDSACIRLLRVKPAIFRADIVECELTVASLDSATKYTALSYTWGAPVFDQPVIINGKKAMITAGLQGALKAYRQEDKCASELLWVDAVSINQKNKREVSQQVPLMKRIYSEADLVFIDLGDVEEAWYEGHDMMQKLCMTYEFEQTRLECNNPGPMPTADEIIKMYRLPPREHIAWKAYAHAFSSPWFRRTWILQEVALATKATARFGRFSIDWKFLDESFYMFTSLGMHIYLQGQSTAAQRGVLNMFKIQDLCHLQKTKPTWSELIRTLRATNHFRASDPRDKVIGILGLIRLPPTQQRLSFLADYTADVDECYHRLALHLVELQLVQIMLSHAGLHRRSCVSTSSPSWVPDWTAQSRDFGPFPLVMFRPKLYQAATSQNMSFKLLGFNPENPLLDTARMRKLSLVGDIIDEVAVLSPARVRYDEEDITPVTDQMAELLQWITSARSSMESAHRELELGRSFNLEAFSRTLLVDDTYTGENATQNSSPILNLEDCYGKAYALLSAAVADPSCSVMSTSGTNTPEQMFVQQVFAASIGKRAAITKGGRMCLVPACAEAGDGVAIFLGANVPYLVRLMEEAKDGGVEESVTACLIGDAYVNGMMDGEALELSHFKSREIVLV